MLYQLFGIYFALIHVIHFIVSERPMLVEILGCSNTIFAGLVNSIHPRMHHIILHNHSFTLISYVHNFVKLFTSILVICTMFSATSNKLISEFHNVVSCFIVYISFNVYDCSVSTIESYYSIDLFICLLISAVSSCAIVYISFTDYNCLVFQIESYNPLTCFSVSSYQLFLLVSFQYDVTLNAMLIHL